MLDRQAFFFRFLSTICLPCRRYDIVDSGVL